MATSRNEFTGAKLQTRPANNTYRSGWDAIFGKKEEVVPEVETEDTETIEAKVDEFVEIEEAAI
jgi:hypothetical protein